MKKSNVIASFLFWTMAVIIVALFMTTLKEGLTVPASVSGFTNGTLIAIIINFFPVILGLMLLIVLLVIIRGNA